MSTAYKPADVERTAQEYWEKTRCFEVQEREDKEKFYCLTMFPYPSGKLHMGHVRNYTIGDVVVRYKRMKGFNVIHPMGWDAFGEPTEQAAIRDGVHPRETTDRNTANFKRQLRLIGTSYDWSREIDTTDPKTGKRKRIVRSGFATKGAAQDALGEHHHGPDPGHDPAGVHVRRGGARNRVGRDLAARVPGGECLSGCASGGGGYRHGRRRGAGQRPDNPRGAPGREGRAGAKRAGNGRCG